MNFPHIDTFSRIGHCIRAPQAIAAYPMESFKKKTLNIFGSLGQEWLDNLPCLIQTLSHQWGLFDLHPIDAPSFNYVLTGLQGSTPIVLKVGLHYDELTREAAALHIYKGFGAVEIRANDPAKGAILLERMMPGTTLKSLFPDHTSDSLKLVCALMKRLHEAPISSPNTFPTLHQWLSDLEKDGPLAPHYLDRARYLKKQLFESHVQPVLLHGDLHFENILLHDTEWVAIDPKGILGDPLADIWPFIREPAIEIPQLAEILNQDPTRIRDWCFVQVSSAAKWNLETNLDTRQLLKFLGKLDQMY